MQGAPTPEAEEWAMPERRENAVMKGVPPRRGAKEPKEFRLPTARGVLSKAEIEALLRPNLPKINETEGAQGEAPGEQPVVFEEVAGTDPDEGRQLAARLTLLFAQSTGLRTAFRYTSARRLKGLTESSVDEVGREASAFICFGRSDEQVSDILEVPAILGDALISHACGGAASLEKTGGAGRTFSAIDCALIEQLLAPVRAAFGPAGQLISVETDRRYVASLVSEDSAERLQFEAILDERSVSVSLLRFGRPDDGARSETGTQPGRRPVQAVLTARLASLSVPVSRVSQLKRGDTLLLGLPADQPVELLSGGRDGVPALEGQIGRKGRNMAIRIRKILRD